LADLLAQNLYKLEAQICELRGRVEAMQTDSLLGRADRLSKQVSELAEACRAQTRLVQEALAQCGALGMKLERESREREVEDCKLREKVRILLDGGGIIDELKVMKRMREAIDGDVKRLLNELTSNYQDKLLQEQRENAAALERAHDVLFSMQTEHSRLEESFNTRLAQELKLVDGKLLLQIARAGQFCLKAIRASDLDRLRMASQLEEREVAFLASRGPRAEERETVPLRGSTGLLETAFSFQLEGGDPLAGIAQPTARSSLLAMLASPMSKLRGHRTPCHDSAKESQVSSRAVA